MFQVHKKDRSVRQRLWGSPPLFRHQQ